MATITAKAIATSNSTYAGWVNGGSITFDDFTSGDKSQDAGSLLVDPSELEKIPTGSIINSVTLYYTSKVNKDNYNAGIYVTPYYLTSYTITGNTYTYTGASKAGDKIQSTLSNSTSGYDGNISFGTWDVSKFKSGMRLAMGVKVTRGSWTLTSCDLTISNIRVVIDYTIPTYYLDLNGMLDGSSSGGISPYGTADVYINGSLAARGVSDYYTAHPEGTTYEIKNIKANEGYKYNGNASYSGTLTAATSVVLSFSTKTACTITYNGNGATSGSVTAQSGYVRDSLTLRDNGFIKKCNVTYYSNENPNITDDSLDELQTSVSSATFLGWYTAAEGGTRVGGSGDSYTPSGDTTLYAHWSAAVTTPTPTRDGYTLLGWYTERSGGTKVADGGGSYTPTGNIALYAHWKINSTNMIYIGTKQPTFYIGTKQVQSIYLGMSLIYEIVQIVDSGTCGSNLTYTLDSNGVLTISGTGDMQNSSFGWDKDLIKSVVINDGVTSIGDYAFDGCKSLTSVSIPDSVMSIGKYAFCNCTGLTDITIPNNVTSIDWGAFAGCTSLTSITIPDSVTSIGNSAFYYCTKLTEIDFSACTDIPTLESSDALSHTSNSLVIKVPSALLNEWKAATNWSTYADKIVSVKG